MLSQAEEQDVYVTMEQCKNQIALGEALERLHNNKDFNLLIVENYQKAYAAKQVSLLADPSANKAVVHEGLQGIAELLAFFRSVEHGAKIAKRTYDEHVEFNQQNEGEE